MPGRARTTRGFIRLALPLPPRTRGSGGSSRSSSWPAPSAGTTGMINYLPTENRYITTWENGFDTSLSLSLPNPTNRVRVFNFSFSFLHCAKTRRRGKHGFPLLINDNIAIQLLARPVKQYPVTAHCSSFRILKRRCGYRRANWPECTLTGRRRNRPTSPMNHLFGAVN